MCRTDGKLREKGYEVIRKYEGKITCEEAVKKIIEKHKMHTGRSWRKI